MRFAGWKNEISRFERYAVHNQRDRESKTNPDIDPDRSHLNVDLINTEKIDEKDVKSEKKIGLFASDRVILERKDFEDIVSPLEVKISTSKGRMKTFKVKRTSL